MDPRHICISDYDYPLPDARIAQEPCTPRDAAKLLVWDRGSLQDLGVRDAPDVVAQWGPYRLVVNEARFRRGFLFRDPAEKDTSSYFTSTPRAYL